MRCDRLLPLIALLAVAACAGDPTPAAVVEPPPPGTPRLLVFLVVDQLATDTLERVRPLLAADGGLRRLLDEGVHYTAAHHGHAITYTGPGHAALTTGHHPATSGIVANDWIDRDRGELVDCVEDDEGRVAPARLLVPAIGDWVKARYPASRVVAASGKDRGAVLVAGRSGDTVLWYDDEVGGFTTSAAYGGPPGWLEAFNRRGLPPELFTDAAWEPLPVDRAAAAGAGFRELDLGPLDHGLPRLLGGYDWLPGERFFEAVYRSPFVDEQLARLATVLLTEESLGTDEWPDLLALSFSALDTVGHAWGPGSLEVLDVLLRLDRLLGDFFALLDRQVGPAMWVAGLSSDHGVMPLPEISASGRERRASLPEVRCLRQAVAAVAERFGEGVWLADDGYLDRRFLARRGLDPRQVEAFAETALSACPGVDEVWTRHEILELPAGATPAPGSAGWIPALYRNAFHPERSPDLFLQSEPDFLPAAGSHTTHASPHPHDTGVPIVLRGPTLTAGTVTSPVLTVDFAPTLAGLLAVPVPEGVVGRPLPPPGTVSGRAGAE
jgi:predicted AlkP superfamily pyrophosphatase or phosphodiesterase